MFVQRCTNHVGISYNLEDLSHCQNIGKTGKINSKVKRKKYYGIFCVMSRNVGGILWLGSSSNLKLKRLRQWNCRGFLKRAFWACDYLKLSTLMTPQEPLWPLRTRFTLYKPWRLSRHLHKNNCHHFTCATQDTPGRKIM